MIRDGGLGSDVEARFDELVDIAREKGLEKISAHFRNGRDPAVLAMRQRLTTQMEGVDVFWDGRANDGHNDSTTHFGKVR